MRYSVLVLAAVLGVGLGKLHGGEQTAAALEEQAIRPAELVVELRLKDAAFDNVKLEYVLKGELVVGPFPAWKFPDFARQHGLENDRAEVVPFRRIETLVVRGRQVTYFSEPDPEFRPKKTRSTLVPFHKSSNADGTFRSISRGDKLGERGNATMEVQKGGYLVDFCHERAMSVEFAHGIGFGKRIKWIDRVEPAGEMLKVTGTIQIWWEDASTFELLLDKHRLVRRATIECNVKGNRTRFEVTSDGTAEAGDIELTRTGSFRRISLGVDAGGKVAPHTKVTNEFQTEFRAIKRPLDDEEYERLIAMPEELNMQVTDHVNNRRYFVGELPRDVPGN